MNGFRAALLRWYETEKRPLPWRESTDMYRVWVSETMLQQTTVAAVVPYFQRWVEAFPTVDRLAIADPGLVDAHWAGLGYYSRCRRLHAAAKSVASNGLPRSLEGLLALPGIGPYSAAAIGSICLNLPVAVVDGNVERVYARLRADESLGTVRKKAAQFWADAVIDRERPGDWNQALMELGAVVCRPKNPRCEVCPVSDWCRAHRAGIQDRIPCASKRPKVTLLEHEIWIAACRGKLGLLQSPKGEWWAGLWGFPRSDDPDVLRGLTRCSEPQFLSCFTHTVTNHRIRVRVSLATTETPSEALSWFTIRQTHELALPAPQKRALKLGGPLLTGPGDPALFEGKEGHLEHEHQGEAVEA